jgi:hypothetical protein
VIPASIWQCKSEEGNSCGIIKDFIWTGSISRKQMTGSKKQHHVENENRFATSENLYAEVDINRTWETIKASKKLLVQKSLGYYEVKRHKPQFDKGCSKLLGPQKQSKLQSLQDLNEINGDNLNITIDKTCNK